MARKKCKKTRSTQISVSIPTHLIDGLDKLAKADNRNRSNFITTLIVQAIERENNESK